MYREWVTTDFQGNCMRREVWVGDTEEGLEQLGKTMCKASWRTEALIEVRQEHLLSRGSSGVFFVHILNISG